MLIYLTNRKGRDILLPEKEEMHVTLERKPAMTLLTELVGEPVQAHCQIDEVPRCRFTVANA